MSWVVTIIAGILGALGGGVGMFAIAFACVKWYRISSFEGGSGYFIVGLTLVGAIFGFVLSIIAARVADAYLGPAWYAQVGGALAVVMVALSLVLAFSYFGADFEPELGGQGIDVVWEVRLPAKGKDDFAPHQNPRDWPDEELRLQLVSVSNHKPRGSSEAEFDRAAFREENGQWILTARVPLFTSKGELCVNLTLGGRDDGFWPAMRPTPHPAYFEWSEWSRTNKGRDKPDDALAVMYRFKFEQATK